MKSVGARVRSLLLVSVVGVATTCRRDAEPSTAPSLTWSASPPLVLAPLAPTAAGDDRGRPAGEGPPILHATLTCTTARDLPAGARLRVRQGFRDDGHELAGAELRYGLPPLAEIGGRVATIGASLVERGTAHRRVEAVVLPLPPERGWFEVVVPEAWPAAAELQVRIGDPTRPEFGPLASELPLDLDLLAELDVAGRSEPVAGTIPVRITATHPQWLRVLTPATVAPGAPVRVVVDFMDGFSGPTRSAAETPWLAGTLECTVGGATHTLAVPADPDPARPHGFSFELPALPAGWHRIAVTFHGAAELRGLSAPLRVSADPADALWFGSLHNHTLLGGHGTSSPPRALAYARDVAALDFVALSEHREAPTFDGAWLATLAERESRPGRFVVFTAFEWTDARAGHRHVVARTPGIPPPAPADLAAFAATIGRDPDQLVVVHHPLWDGGKAQSGYDYGAPDALPRQLLAEAYSWHGESLRRDSDFPLHGNHEQELPASQKTEIVAALAADHHLFLVADSDNHLGRPGGLVGIEWPHGRRYAFQGVTAVRARELTRDALFAALERGEIYGTTGARMQLRATRSERGVAVEIHGAAPLARVELTSPTRLLARRDFPSAERSAGLADAPLFVDVARCGGEWDAQLDLDAGSDAPVDEPWIVEVTQQDFHHAWQLLAPASWSRH